jgi:hypothetical protein
MRLFPFGPSRRVRLIIKPASSCTRRKRVLTVSWMAVGGWRCLLRIHPTNAACCHLPIPFPPGRHFGGLGAQGSPPVRGARSSGDSLCPDAPAPRPPPPFIAGLEIRRSHAVGVDSHQYRQHSAINCRSYTQKSGPNGSYSIFSPTDSPEEPITPRQQNLWVNSGSARSPRLW